MVYVMALGPGRGQNGGIGNRRYMVAAYRTGQHGSHRHNHKMGIIGHDSQYDRNEDTEGAPGSTGSKSKANGHQEKQGRQQNSNGGVISNHASYIAADVQVILTYNAGQGPGQGQDHNGRSHLFETFYKAAAESAEV